MSVSLPLDILRAFQVRLRASQQDGRLGFDISPHSLPSKGVSPTVNGAPIILSFTPFEDDKGHGLSVEALTIDQAQSAPGHQPQAFCGHNDPSSGSLGVNLDPTLSTQQTAFHASLLSDNAVAGLSRVSSHAALATLPQTPEYPTNIPALPVPSSFNDASISCDSLLALLQSQVAVAQPSNASLFAPSDFVDPSTTHGGLGSSFEDQFLSVQSTSVFNAASSDPLQFHETLFDAAPLDSMMDLLPPTDPHAPLGASPEAASSSSSSEQGDPVDTVTLETPGARSTPSNSPAASSSHSSPAPDEAYTFACTTASADGRIRAGGNKRPRRLACSDPSCTRRFTTEYTRRVHERTHSGEQRAAIACTMGCEETFSRQHDRLRHEVSKHGKVCEHVCASCGHFFSSDRQLHIHVGKCGGEKRRGRWSVKNKD